MSFANKLKLKAQAYDLDLRAAPGHWFFCRRIEIPSDLEEGEEDGFALLELETLSPFPLDHLQYGYRMAKDRRHAFLFAAYKRRFDLTESASWRRMDGVLPDFLLALHEKARASEGLVLETAEAYCAFSYDEESELPSGFYAEPKPEPAEEDETSENDVQANLQGFLDRAKARLQEDAFRIAHVDTTPKWEGGLAWFEASDSEGKRFARVSFDRAILWKADLRDPEMVELAKRDERQNGLLWKGIGVIAAGIGLLLLGELYWMGSSLYLGFREDRIEQRVDPVATINELRSTSTTLRDFQESNLAPFAMLESLFPLQQYPNIIYRKFETAGPDTLVIDAKAANQTEVTAFKKRLESHAPVESAELSKLVNNPAGTTFTATIRFRIGAFLAAKKKEAGHGGS